MTENIQSTDLRCRVREVLEQVRIKRQPIIIKSYDTPRAVLIPYEDFEDYRAWLESRARRQAWLAELRAIAEEVSARAARTLWLNPEPPVLWGTGDSDMHRYAPYCDQVLKVATLAELIAAIDTILEG